MRLEETGLSEGPIVLKVDVEGHEFEVLQGAASLFDRTRIAVVFLDGFEKPSIPRLLADRGFVLFDAATLHPFEVQRSYWRSTPHGLRL
jgi:Methyltransferase FkbM domain